MTTNTTTRKAHPRPAPRQVPRPVFEACIDAGLDKLVTEAAEKRGVSTTAFASDAARDAAMKVIAHADVTLMAAEIFDRIMASIDIADDSPELEELAALPRHITK